MAGRIVFFSGVLALGFLLGRHLPGPPPPPVARASSSEAAPRDAEDPREVLRFEVLAEEGGGALGRARVRLDQPGRPGSWRPVDAAGGVAFRVHPARVGVARLRVQAPGREPLDWRMRPERLRGGLWRVALRPSGGRLRVTGALLAGEGAREARLLWRVEPSEPGAAAPRPPAAAGRLGDLDLERLSAGRLGFSIPDLPSRGRLRLRARVRTPGGAERIFAARVELGEAGPAPGIDLGTLGPRRPQLLLKLFDERGKVMPRRELTIFEAGVLEGRTVSTDASGALLLGRLRPGEGPGIWRLFDGERARPGLRVTSASGPEQRASWPIARK